MVISNIVITIVIDIINIVLVISTYPSTHSIVPSLLLSLNPIHR